MEYRHTATAQTQVLTAPVRILLVMDEVVVRTGLRMLIESWPEMRVAGEISSTAEAFAIACKERPDIALYDAACNSGDRNSDFLDRLVHSMGSRAVILLTAEDEPSGRLRAIGVGVNGVVCKAKALQDLRTAILKVHAGELWLDRISTARFILQITRSTYSGTPDPAQSRIALLSQRERQIAQLVCQGLQNEEIGKRLSISDITVRHHLTSIYARIGVSSRLELTVFLYRNNFVGLSQEPVLSWR